MNIRSSLFYTVKEKGMDKNQFEAKKIKKY